MLEFVFFDPRPRDRFVVFLREQGVAVTLIDDDESLGVGIPEETDDALLEQIESEYDAMMAYDRELFEAEPGTVDRHAAGVVLNLQSGETIYAQVDPVLLGRVMEVLTPQEFGSVVNAIVDAVENPTQAALCGRPARDS